MYCNFGNIPFYTETNYSGQSNVGWYRCIEKNGTEIKTDTVGSNLFLTSSDYSVRMLTLPEINNDRSASCAITSEEIISSTDDLAIGLYKLEDICNLTYLESYNYRWSPYYWLASLDIQGDGSDICNVRADGEINYNSYYWQKLRHPPSYPV